MEEIKKLTPIPLPPIDAKPLVSVITPCYNAEPYIAEVIRDVQAQTYQNWEMIICDDGSTDGSSETASELVATDSRIKLISQPNGGSASATNAAFKHSKGRIIVFQDADDLMHPQRLEKTVEAFRSHPQAGFMTHRLQYIDGEGSMCRLIVPRPHLRLVKGWMGEHPLNMTDYASTAPSSGTAVRREIMERITPIPKNCWKTQDAFVSGTAMWLTRCTNVDEVLGYYRIHENNQSSSTSWNYQDLLREIKVKQDLKNAFASFLSSEGHVELAEKVKKKKPAWFWEILCRCWVVQRKMPPEAEGQSFMDALKRIGYKKRRYYLILSMLPKIGTVYILKKRHAWVARKQMAKAEISGSS